MRSPEIDDPSAENQAKAAEQVVRLQGLVRELAREENIEGPGSPINYYGGAWARLMVVRDKGDSSHYEPMTTGRVEDFSHSRGVPRIYTQTGEDTGITLLSHIHIYEDGAHCWGVGIQGDFPALFSIEREETRGSYAHLIEPEPTVLRSMGNGQQAAQLTRLLTLMRRHAYFLTAD
jgi:hypothetical protein